MGLVFRIFCLIYTAINRIFIAIQSRSYTLNCEHSRFTIFPLLSLTQSAANCILIHRSARKRLFFKTVNAQI